MTCHVRFAYRSRPILGALARTLLLAALLLLAAVPTALAQGNSQGRGGGGGGGGGDDGGGDQPPPAEIGIRYDFVPLMNLPCGGTPRTAMDMNNDGFVVGRAFGPFDDDPERIATKGFVCFSPDEPPVPVETLSDEYPICRVAVGINDVGQILGTGASSSVVAGVSGGRDQLLYTPTGDGSLYTVEVVAENVYFVGGQINNQGDVSGLFWDWDDGWRGYVWTEEDKFVDLGNHVPDGTDSRVTGMSDRDADGYIELYGISDGVAWRAVYLAGSAAAEDMPPKVHWESLGYIYSHRRTPGGSSVHGNSLGVLVGSTTTSDGRRAARYTDEQAWESLGTLAPPKSKSGHVSVAYSVNELGVVVGDSRIGDPDDATNRRSFIHTDDSGMVMLEQLIDDLPEEAIGLLSPRAINMIGEICGPRHRNEIGLAETYDRAYVLIPKDR